jgi:NADH-ubiquinone oxidoreductase chain 5
LIYNKYIVENILTLGGQTTKSLDKGSVEYLGPYGLEKGLLNLSNSINNLSTGVVTTYALYILMGLMFYITTLYFFNWDSNLLILIIFSLFVILNNKLFLQK